MGLYLVLPDRGLAQNNQGQNELGVPNGTYSVHITGLVTPPGFTTMVPLAVAGRATYFANGRTSGVFSVSINGQVQKVTATGTFTANGDGSFSETDQNSLGETLNFRLWPTLDGNIINEIQFETGAVVTGVLTR
jgi:hypothetical protein